MMLRPRILLADDDPLVREKLKNLLEQRFSVPGTFGDGEALVAASRQLQPDLVVMDVSMPKLNGFDAARKLRTILPDVGIIFVTGYADSAYDDEARRLGAFACLPKKSVVSKLIPSIEQALRPSSSTSRASLQQDSSS
ncbi:MAG: response regulator transcription factor [Acidobacteriota bacterium]